MVELVLAEDDGNDNLIVDTTSLCVVCVQQSYNFQKKTVQFISDY